MIERYTRVYAVLGDRECTVGLEQRDGDSYKDISSILKSDAESVLRKYDGQSDWISGAQDDMERSVLSWFPDRSFFFEFEEDGVGCQVYRPHRRKGPTNVQAGQ